MWIHLLIRFIALIADHTDIPLVAVSAVIFKSDTTVCGSASVSTIPPRSVVSTRVHLGLKSYHQHALSLSCSTSKQQDFQKRSLVSQLHLEDPPQIACTTTGGFASSLTGLQNKELIRLVPRLLR